MSTKPKVTYQVILLPEEIPVRGNVLASGDDAQDLAQETWVLAELERGNVAAWCIAKVVASIELENQSFEGVAYLGGVSYESEKACMRAMLEDTDLRESALEDLRNALTRNKRRGLAASLALESL